MVDWNADPVLLMLAEYYNDLENAMEIDGSTAHRAEEILVNMRVLVGRHLDRVRRFEGAGKVFFCVGYKTPHFWWITSDTMDEERPSSEHFYLRCAEHPNRRSDA